VEIGLSDKGTHFRLQFSGTWDEVPAKNVIFANVQNNGI